MHTVDQHKVTKLFFNWVTLYSTNNMPRQAWLRLVCHSLSREVTVQSVQELAYLSLCSEIIHVSIHSCLFFYILDTLHFHNTIENSRVSLLKFCVNEQLRKVWGHDIRRRIYTRALSAHAHLPRNRRSKETPIPLRTHIARLILIEHYHI